MRPIFISTALCAIALCTPLALQADESSVRLKEGKGREMVEAHCVACHSLDYIQMNSVFLDRKGWEGSVNKMINIMGAQVPPEDTSPIIEYLARYYGK